MDTDLLSERRHTRGTSRFTPAAGLSGKWKGWGHSFFRPRWDTAWCNTTAAWESACCSSRGAAYCPGSTSGDSSQMSQSPRLWHAQPLSPEAEPEQGQGCRPPPTARLSPRKVATLHRAVTGSGSIPFPAWAWLPGTEAKNARGEPVQQEDRARLRAPPPHTHR